MKVIVVDDSIVFRSAIVATLTGDPSIEVARTLVNGKAAVDFIQANPDIDLITLDMEMPVMDGMEAIREIRKFNKHVVIIVFSAISQKGAEKTIEALNAGANDFVTKPEHSGNTDSSVNLIKEELLPKVLAFKDRISRKQKIPFTEIHVPRPVIKVPEELKSSPSTSHFDLKLSYSPDLVVIGCSTGGPEALSNIFKNIKSKLRVPILIVQHMPPIFTEKLAEMLNKLSPNEVSEAKEGDLLRPGQCYVAPGNFHMVVDSGKKIHLNQEEKVCYVRPSVDVLFQSVSTQFRGNVLTIVLTGMGEDGAEGAKALHAKGSTIFVQDKETSVVWGMPGAVKKHVESARAINLEQVSDLIESNCK